MYNNYNYNNYQGFTSHGSTGSAAGATGHAATAPSNSYLGPSSYDVDAHPHNEQNNNIYHSDGGYQ